MSSVMSDADSIELTTYGICRSVCRSVCHSRRRRPYRQNTDMQRGEVSVRLRKLTSDVVVIRSHV